MKILLFLILTLFQLNAFAASETMFDELVQFDSGKPGSMSLAGWVTTAGSKVTIKKPQFSSPGIIQIFSESRQNTPISFGYPLSPKSDLNYICKMYGYKEASSKVKIAPNVVEGAVPLIVQGKSGKPASNQLSTDLDNYPDIVEEFSCNF